jgi:hypothetical protein
MKLTHLACFLGLSWTLSTLAYAGTTEIKTEDDNRTASAPSAAAMTDPAGADNPDPAPPGSGGTAGDWHVSVSPYLWFPGIHGTVGAFGRDANLSMSAIDLLSHIDFGLMGFVEARWRRLVLPVDAIWVRLAADRAVPTVGLGAISVNLRSSLFVLTPKVGVRLLDEPKIKCDFLAGIRYWHLGQTLKFSPANLGSLNFSASQNWVDPMVGGRIESPLTRKLVATLFGDVGGWGTGSQLEYQVGGALGYSLKESMILQAGYRYLNVNYRGGGVTQPVFDTHLSGVVLGVTFKLR